MTRERLTVKKLYDLLEGTYKRVSSIELSIHDVAQSDPGFDWGAFLLGGLSGGLISAILYIFLLVHYVR